MGLHRIIYIYIYIIIRIYIYIYMASGCLVAKSEIIAQASVTETLGVVSFFLLLREGSKLLQVRVPLLNVLPSSKSLAFFFVSFFFIPWPSFACWSVVWQQYQSTTAKNPAWQVPETWRQSGDPSHLCPWRALWNIQAGPGGLRDCSCSWPCLCGCYTTNVALRFITPPRIMSFFPCTDL